jgi:hypothetical protein
MGPEGLARLNMTSIIIQHMAVVFNALMKDSEEDLDDVMFELPLPYLRKLDQQLTDVLEPFIAALMKHLVNKKALWCGPEEHRQSAFEAAARAGALALDAGLPQDLVEVQVWMTMLGAELFSAARVVQDFYTLYQEALEDERQRVRVMEAAAQALSPAGVTRMLDLGVGTVPSDAAGAANAQSSSGSSSSSRGIELQLVSPGATGSMITTLYYLLDYLGKEQLMAVAEHQPLKLYFIKVLKGDREVTQLWRRCVTADISSFFSHTMGLYSGCFEMLASEGEEGGQQVVCRRVLRRLCDQDFVEACNGAAAVW